MISLVNATLSILLKCASSFIYLRFKTRHNVTIIIFRRIQSKRPAVSSYSH